MREPNRGAASEADDDVGSAVAVWLLRPLPVSVATGLCAFLVHPWGGQTLRRPMSLELRDGNLFAHLVIVGLAWLVVLLGLRFWRYRQFLSAAACAFCLAMLVVIPVTDPYAAGHQMAFAGLVVVAIGLFLVWAMDTLDVTEAAPPLLPVLMGLPCAHVLGIGGFQVLVIVSLLVALNRTYGHVERRAIV